MVDRDVHRLDPSTDPEGVTGRQRSDSRMGGVSRSEDQSSFGVAVLLPDIFDVKHRETAPFRLPKSHARSGFKRIGELFGDVERDRQRPQRPIGEAHVVADRFVVVARHESLQRRKGAGDE